MATVLPPYPSPWDLSTATVPTHYYHFGYGSNLWLKQMAKRCPQYTYVGKGVLRGYKWVINERGYANVIPAGDQAKGDDPDEFRCYGVVYTLSKSDMESLDRYEGVHLKPVPAYVKVTMPIDIYEPGDNKALPCLVYVDPRTALGKPRKEYVRRIILGLIDARLPDSWVEYIIRKLIPEGVGMEVMDENESGSGSGSEENLGERG